MDRLLPEERGIVSRAKVGASHEVESLIQIIERLTGEVVAPADEVPRPQKIFALYGSKIKHEPRPVLCVRTGAHPIDECPATERVPR